MNPPPDSGLINLCTIGFILLVLYFASQAKKKNCIASDMVEVLYEVDPAYLAAQYYPKPQPKPKTQKPKNNLVKSQPKPKTKPKPQPIKKVDKIVQEYNPVIITPPKPVKITRNNFNPLQKDCVNALVSLGMKKGEANKTVIDIFTKHEIASIEDFIKKAFVPNEYYRSSL